MDGLVVAADCWLACGWPVGPQVFWIDANAELRRPMDEVQRAMQVGHTHTKRQAGRAVVPVVSRSVWRVGLAGWLPPQESGHFFTTQPYDFPTAQFHHPHTVSEAATPPPPPPHRPQRATHSTPALSSSAHWAPSMSVAGCQVRALGCEAADLSRQHCSTAFLGFTRGGWAHTEVGQHHDHRTQLLLLRSVRRLVVVTGRMGGLPCRSWVPPWRAPSSPTASTRPAATAETTDRLVGTLPPPTPTRTSKPDALTSYVAWTCPWLGAGGVAGADGDERRHVSSGRERVPARDEVAPDLGLRKRRPPAAAHGRRDGLERAGAVHPKELPRQALPTTPAPQQRRQHAITTTRPRRSLMARLRAPAGPS